MNKLGLVFSGGGGKGAYEIGAWKALNEFGIDANVEAVAGTSVGGLNAALFVQGDLAAAEDLWRNISRDQIMAINKDNIAKGAVGIASAFFTPSVVARAVMAVTKLSDFQGLFNQDGLANLIKSSGACEKVTDAHLPLHVCALNSETRSLEYPKLNGMQPDKVADWLLASAAIPIVFNGIEIKGTTYYDGGVLPGEYSDNTPFKTLIEEYDCTYIINIYLERSPEMAVAQKAYPNIRFWNIVPTREFDGVIAPLNFTPENAAKLIDEGYEDVKCILEQFKAFQGSEERYMNAVFDFAASNEYFVNQIDLNKNLRSGEIKQAGTLEEVTQQIAREIDVQEQGLISDQIDDLIEEMQENSVELLDEAFAAITTLASTEGTINVQLEQSRFGRILGNLTGSNNQMQAEVNYGLNRAIYANQQLIQKLNHKSMLSMEAVASLSNKTNYLMNHVNVLYGSIQLTEQRVNRSLALMKSGLEALENTLNMRIDGVAQRVENLERNTLINDWFHNTVAMGQVSNPYQALLNTTASFYLTTGRSWDNIELSRFNNALMGLQIKDTPLIPATLMWESKKNNLLERVESQHILPIDPKKQNGFPLLKGIQMVDEQVEGRDVTAELEQDLNLNLFVERPAAELGLELLNALRQNDRRAPALTTSQQGENQHLLENNQLASVLQSDWLTAINELESVNQSHIKHDGISADLTFLKEKVEQFKVVIPITGKFSSGKSSLLNSYLGTDYLKTDIAPETAIATELCYGETEQITVHYLDETKPTTLPVASISDFTVTDNMAFIHVELNNARLKNRPNITLVDMPGFDAKNIAHQKAIATYLDRGDFFINLMPVDIPFDASIIQRLEEIYFDYGKEITCLLSKAARKSPTQLAENITQLEQILFANFQQKITIGTLETQDKDHFTIQDFEDQVDNATRQFDALLKSRYQQPLLEVINALEEQLKTNIRYATNTASEIEEKIQSSTQAFEIIKKQLLLNTDELKYDLCCVGKETLTGKVTSILNGNASQLVVAAKSSSLPDTLANLIRPVLQIELDELIKHELAKFENKLDSQNAMEFSGINVQIQIPQIEKEAFSVKTAAICAGISMLVLGPVGVIVSGLIGGIFGRKDNEKECNNQIEQQVHNQVIPQAITQVMNDVETHLLQTVMQFEKQVLAQLEQEKQSHNTLLAELQQQHKERSGEFATMQAELQQGLNRVLDTKNKLQ